MFIRLHCTSPEENFLPNPTAADCSGFLVVYFCEKVPPVGWNFLKLVFFLKDQGRLTGPSGCGEVPLPLGPELVGGGGF